MESHLVQAVIRVKRCRAESPIPSMVLEPPAAKRRHSCAASFPPPLCASRAGPASLPPSRADLEPVGSAWAHDGYPDAEHGATEAFWATSPRVGPAMPRVSPRAAAATANPLATRSRRATEQLETSRAARNAVIAAYRGIEEETTLITIKHVSDLRLGPSLDDSDDAPAANGACAYDLYCVMRPKRPVQQEDYTGYEGMDTTGDDDATLCPGDRPSASISDSDAIAAKEMFCNSEGVPVFVSDGLECAVFVFPESRLHYVCRLESAGAVSRPTCGVRFAASGARRMAHVVLSGDAAIDLDILGAFPSFEAPSLILARAQARDGEDVSNSAKFGLFQVAGNMWRIINLAAFGGS